MLGGLVGGCGRDEPAPTPAPTRWDLLPELPGATRVPDAHQNFDEYDPQGCSLRDTLRGIADTVDVDLIPKNKIEFGEYAADGLQIKYFVTWTSPNFYETGAEVAGKLYDEIQSCATDPRARTVSDYKGYYTFVPIESPSDGRFGWYESTEKPDGWTPLANDLLTEEEKDHMGAPATGPHQGLAMYTLVDDWILVSVVVTSEDTTTDLRESFDLDGLLGELAAKVDADPITKYDFEHRRDLD